jgi:2-amino-4-hydroxy-6-hydroxymethyldihydropteridine diphosphokinase
MIAWIGLGANLSDPVLQLDRALERLCAIEQLRCMRRSSYYHTPPWGDKDQDDFVNAVVEVETSLEPLDLLHELQAIELTMGRQRHHRRWGPRLIDLDLLLYGDVRLQTKELELPHPRLHQRAFVLLPLSELDENLLIPGQGFVGELLDNVDLTGIRRLHTPDGA